MGARGRRPAEPADWRADRRWGGCVTRAQDPDHRLRPIGTTEYPAAARLWHDAWHETQRGSLPDELADLRTLDDFESRLIALGDFVRVAVFDDNIQGLCAIKDADPDANDPAPGELYQLFTAPTSRGSGIGAALIQDAEDRLRARGHATAFLKCLPDNDAALRFYRRHGWGGSGTKNVSLDTSKGPFIVPCALLTKDLTDK